MFLPGTKQVSTKLTFVSGALLLIGMVSSLYVYILVDHSSKAHILDRVDTIATLLPAESISALSGTEADSANPAYRELKAQLIGLRNANSDARFVYVIGQHEDGQQFFYADSEDPTSEEYSPPGQAYDEATPPMHALFADGQSRIEGVSSDRWGLWISGYAPVKDEEGRVHALVGMDLPAYQYVLTLTIYSILPVFVALMLVLLLWLGESGRRREARALEEKSEFLSIASHEIRTPLVGIRWALETMRARGADRYDARTLELITLAHDASVGVVARIGNLLSAPATGKDAFTSVQERVLVRTLIDDIISAVRLSASSRDLTLSADEGMQHLSALRTNRELLYQALFNVVSNAVKYALPKTEVQIRGEEDASSLRISVTDHGAGIPQAEQELIFAGYHRTEAARQSGQPGTGLGLYMTKRIIEKLGGAISVVSAPGAPTTFTITLPKS